MRTFVRQALACALAIATVGCHRASDTAVALTGGSPQRGVDAIAKYGCGGCHDSPGVPSAEGTVGPSLDEIGARMYLAGQIPNTTDNMLRWIRHPQQARPGTVMPEMNVTERDARDIAAYLYTLQ
jgi:cytochrome c1